MSVSEELRAYSSPNPTTVNWQQGGLEEGYTLLKFLYILNN